MRGKPLRISSLLMAAALVGWWTGGFAGTKDDFRGVVISCAAAGKELELCREGTEAWSQETGIPVRVVAAPNDSSERLGTYILLLASRSADIDIFSIDTTWPGIIGDYFIDLNPHVDASALAEQFSGFLRNNIVEDRLVALPWFIDAGVLYYRKDLLAKYGEEPPATWEELTRIAKKIQAGERKNGNNDLWGLVFQGRAYAGLVCNALEWISSYGGGTFVDEKGEVTINNPSAEKALKLAASWVGEISPRGVLNYTEEESRGVFQSGKSVFMRNWPYAKKLVNGAESSVRGKVGVTLLPRGNPSAEGKRGEAVSVATLGGWSLAVSKRSRHPEAAIGLAKYLTSEKEQRRRLESGGFHPTWRSIYRDPEVLRKDSFLGVLYSVFQGAVSRPARSTRTKYNRVSLEIAEAVHRVLAHEESAPSALAKLENTLKKIGKNGRW